MKAIRSAIVAGLVVMGACSTWAAAQQKRVSPPDVTGAVIEGSRVTVYYGRPYTKDPKTGEPRKIWGGLVPFDKVWRLGANEATLLTTQKDIEIGGAAVPAGAYTLFMLPTEDGGKLIINKQVGQWGTQYDEKQDLARVDLKMEKPEKKADQFTMQVARGKDGGGVIRMTWEDRQYSVPFTVKK